jgi:hypothetical protein
MALSAELKQILACPKCKGELEFHEDKHEIHCKACRLCFSIDAEHDIADMRLEKARPLE